MLILFSGIAIIYATGSRSADPGIGIARPDLDIVRQWQTTGRLQDDRSGSHLTKPGYLAYLRATLPSRGERFSERRRFVILNALWICAGVALGAWSLWRRRIRWAGVGFLAYVLIHTGLRDSTDYVAGEPLATGAGLAFVALLIAVQRPTVRSWGAAGLLATILYLLRPNLGALCLAIAAIVILGGGSPKLPSLLALAGGSGAGILFVVALLLVTGEPVQKLKTDSAKALVWGSADYYWRPDIGAWPTGNSPQETARLEVRGSVARWRSVFHQARPDAVRSLTWRTGHLLLSSEQLPPRWQSSSWLLFDAFARRWWWCAAMLAACASVAVAIGSQDTWRWVPVLICGSLVAQGIAFGSDPRFALPLYPMLALSLALALPTVRWSGRCYAGAALAASCVAVVLWMVPESANSDFAFVQGPGHVIEQTISVRRMPLSGPVVFHVRILKPDSVRLGWEIFANDRRVSERSADDAPSPAFQTFTLDGEELVAARRAGLGLRIRTTGDASTRDAYVYYPVAPRPLDGVSTVDGSERLPSLWSDRNRGGIPIWWHAAAAGD